MAVTLKQLARELGLHHSTVAYALSGKGTVKPETRDRVREAAAQLGYVVNGLARRMRAKRTDTIGLVIPDVVSSCSEFTQRVFRDVLGRGYDSQVMLTEGDPELEDKAVRQLLESRVDGIVLHSVFARWADVPAHHTLRQVAAMGIPTVCYGFPIDGAPFPCVEHPVIRQAEMLAEHLIAEGHKRLAWLMPPDAGALNRCAEYLLDGTRRALAAARMPASAVGVVTLGADEGEASDPAGLSRVLPRAAARHGRQLMRCAMAAAPRPTAVLCPNDVTAIGAMIEAAEMGLRVPHDVAIAASTRTIAAELAPMPLTTADVPPGEGVRVVLDELMRLIAEKAGGERHDAGAVNPDPELVVGRSTRA